MIVFDLETVPDQDTIQTRQWAEYKAKKNIVNDQDAALHPVFGRIVCACAFSTESNDTLSICGPDEKDILEKVSTLFFKQERERLAGHNIKGFDIPFLCHKLLKHKMAFPKQLKVAGKKPWQIEHIDTVELMQFGSGPYISLDQMCLHLEVDSPKEGEVNALGVWDAFKAGQYDLIAQYCKADVRAWYKCYTRMQEAL